MFHAVVNGAVVTLAAMVAVLDQQGITQTWDHAILVRAALERLLSDQRLDEHEYGVELVQRQLHEMLTNMPGVDTSP